MSALFQSYPGLVTAGGAFVIWILTRWLELVRAAQNARREKRNFIRALFAEVDFNTRDLAFFVMNSADVDKIEQAMLKDANLRPHVTDAHHTIIYSENIQKMHVLDDGLAARLVMFYGILEKIKIQIDGINLPSFASVSATGKATVIRRLVTLVNECEQEGEVILGKFADAYPRLQLTRHPRQSRNRNNRQMTIGSGPCTTFISSVRPQHRAPAPGLQENSYFNCLHYRVPPLTALIN